jgi:DNA polymerase elongation subunit (family B)
MKTIFFDIETGPLPEREFAEMVPPFDRAGVKVGNSKDPEKIAAKRAEAEANYRRECMEGAALDSLTGRVLAIGLLSEHGEFHVIGQEDEEATLREFWTVCQGEPRANRMIGFNSRAFDLPFLIRRSFKHRVGIPCGIRCGRFWAEEMVDLREEWQLGDRQARGSLDAIAKYLGVGQKNGHGEDFARLWKENRDRAVEYLRRDVEPTAKIAEVLRIAELPVGQSQPSPQENRGQSLPKREQLSTCESYSIVK